MWRPVVPFFVLLALASLSRAQDKGIVISGNARFTVITPNLIRIEYDQNGGRFTDDRSLFAIDRTARAPFDRSNGIDTGSIRITFPEKPRLEDIHAQIRHGDRWIDWHPGQKNEHNLGGTLRTLDGVSGPTDVGEGILSRDGWYLLDDSKTPLLTDDGWVRSRHKDAGIDWYLFGYGSDYRAALKSLTTISGPVPLPRKYQLGVWYSRYWPYTSKDYRDIVNEYAEHDFPLDVIVMDMDWHITDLPGVKRAHAGQIWTGYTWDKKLIPDPDELLKWFHEQGLHVTLNDHPADGVQPHEVMYEAFMRELGEDPASKKTIPFDAGNRNYLDAFWKHTHQPMLDAGVDFWWLDWQQFPFTRSIPELTNLWWLNDYYYQHTSSNSLRGASFSRWAGWGDHRHPIHFSGDASTNWETLRFEVPFTSTAGNVGCFFWSHDIGGHMGGRNEESYVRWCQFGALSAALRSHSTRDANMDRRPWKYPKWAEDSMRKSFHLRSELFPYIYSSAAQSCRESVPLTRPMYIDYPNEEEAYHNPQQFMLGDHLLVAPITSPGQGERRTATQVVWFPPGDDWYDFFSGARYEGGTEQVVSCDIDSFPLFVRGGTAIPMQPYTPRMANDLLKSLIVRVYPGRDGTTRSTALYEDDGFSNAYRDGACAKTEILYARRGQHQEIEIKPTHGKFAGEPTTREQFVQFGSDERTRADPSGRASSDRVHDRRGIGQTTFFCKFESPSGYPATLTRYLYLPAVNARRGQVDWRLREGSRTLQEAHSPARPKVPVPTFPPQPRPDNLHAQFKLVASVGAEGDVTDVELPVSILDRPFNAARDATATASSTERDYSPAGAIDGVADGYPHGKSYEWASNHEKTGASLKLEWKDPQRIDAILLYDRPNLTDQITTGVITFDDGSTVNVGPLPNDGNEAAEVRFDPRTVRWVELKITGVSDTTQNAGLAEIAVFRAP
jgi:alpha-glucosidase (family GH31 glycosyl hydrolase)